MAAASSLLLVAYPVFDPDLYWHLANGREMFARGTIVNQEIFSYTHAGEPFVNHEWLSQLIFYSCWKSAGLVGLYFVKAAAVLMLVWLVQATARGHGVGPAAAAGLAVVCVLSGLERFHVRPELFTLVGIAAVFYLVRGAGAPRCGRKTAWLLPALFAVWDCLHGAVIGIVLLAVIVMAANLQRHRPTSGARSGDLRRLNLSFLAVILVSLLNPYGVRSYEHFQILAAATHGSDRIIELQPMWRRPDAHVAFLAWLALAVATTISRRRRADLGDVLLLLVFGILAVRFNRLSGAAAIILTPIIARAAAADWRAGLRVQWRYVAWVLAAVACLVAARAKFMGIHGGMAPDGTYVVPPATCLRIGANEEMTPAGSVRFLQDAGLTGNMYNNANLAGYLCLYATPARRIFQYNMPPIFGDTTRFVRTPAELAPWHIAYGLAGSPGELSLLFPRRDWAWVFSDYVSTLVVRRTPENKALIDQYEIRYFAPEQSDAQYRAQAADAGVCPRLAFEMGVYLKYMRDERISARWRKLLQEDPQLAGRPEIRELLEPVGTMNPKT